MDFLEQAKLHWTEKRGALKSIDVPEWGAKIYYKPMTRDEKKAIYIKDAHWADIALNMVLVRSLDEDGNRLFKSVHRTELNKQVDPEVVDRIAAEMSETDPTEEEVEKK